MSELTKYDEVALPPTSVIEETRAEALAALDKVRELVVSATCPTVSLFFADCKAYPPTPENTTMAAARAGVAQLILLHYMTAAAELGEQIEAANKKDAEDNKEEGVA